MTTNHAEARDKTIRALIALRNAHDLMIETGCTSQEAWEFCAANGVPIAIFETKTAKRYQ